MAESGLDNKQHKGQENGKQAELNPSEKWTNRFRYQ